MFIIIGFLRRRLLGSVLVLVLASIAVFSLIHLAPGDAAGTIAGPEATADEIADIRANLGLDRPVVVQYYDWAAAAIRGDFGSSLRSSQSVAAALVDRLPVTLSLTLGAVLISLLIAIPAGVFAALHPNSVIDRVLTTFMTVGIASPGFVVGLVLVYVFGLSFRLLPVTGYVSPSVSVLDWAAHLMLPCLALSTTVTAELGRHVRSAIREVLERDYIRTAHAKGLPTTAVVIKHALKPGAIPVITVIGLQIAHLLGGSIVVEQVFAIPGLGSLGIKAVFDRDYPMIQGFTLMAALMVIFANFLVDLSYAYFNPRMRLMEVSR